jgi:hypothetical protein
VAQHAAATVDRSGDWSHPHRDHPARPVPGLGRELGAVGAIAFTLYALTLSRVPALTQDSMSYLLAIRSGGYALWHPHHLAYNALARAWLDALGAVGLDGDPLVRVELLNAVLGASAAALVWAILRLRAGLPRGIAAAATTGAAVSYGVWFYSVSVEVYLLPLVLLLACLLVLTAPEVSVRTMAVVGVVNGLAVVAHQVNVLFAVVVVAVAARGVDRRALARRLAAYAASASVLVLAAYAAVIALVVRPKGPGDAADWFTRYTQARGYWQLDVDAPAKAAFGWSRALVGGQFVFRLRPVRERLLESFADRSVDDETFLVRHLPAAAAAVLVAAAVVAAALLAFGLARGMLRRRSLPREARRLVRPLVAWLVTYALFFVIWEPDNPEFWIPQVTVLWLLAAVLAAPRPGESPARPHRRALALGVAACTVGLVNLVGTVLPATRSGNDVYAVRYRVLGREVDAGDLVVVDRPHLGFGYTRRYTQARPVDDTGYSYFVPVEDGMPSPPEELADQAAGALGRGHRVAIDAELVERPSGFWAAHTGQVLADRFGDRWRVVQVAGGELSGWYLLEPSG